MDRINRTDRINRDDRDRTDEMNRNDMIDRINKAMAVDWKVFHRYLS